MNLPEPFSDEHLASRCRDGDSHAWSLLVRRHSRIVFSLALRSCRRRDEAEDLVQEVFMKVSRTLESYDANQPFKPWLMQVTRRHLIDQHRSHRREREATLELDGILYEPATTRPDQAEELLSQQRASLVRRALLQVPDKLREAVMLRDVDGLDYDEIAAAIDLPLGTVKSRINRGRIAIAAILAPHRAELS